MLAGLASGVQAAEKPGDKPAEKSAHNCAQGQAHLATHDFGAVKGVSKGPLIDLEAGSSLRLAGLVIPAVPRNRKDVEAVKNANAALTYLRKVVAGRSLLAHPAFKADRHGRKWAQLFVTSGDADERRWLQAALVEAGYARVSPATRGSSCANILLKLEARARTEKTGLWDQERFTVLEAWATRKLRRRENSFQLVRGKVTGVAETKRVTYVNFGKDWRTDFTVNISTRTAKRLKKVGFQPADLKGKMVRVRGWVTYANGPMIRVRAAEQIEILDASDK
ncbi:MAG: thermonuclease family protein [Alphaproteobacteria bacterium]|nr:thermonuclease family protein [Alphaproteobacteria bacterium]